MSEQKLAVYIGRSTTLLAADAEQIVKDAARKLMRMAPGGNHLDVGQATDLAVYAFMTGLNPFNGECYYMDKVGIVPGIAGYRVKAMDWIVSNLAATGKRLDTTPRLWEEYRPATTDEADFDPDKGDVAWVCTLYDSVSRDAWQSSRIMLGMKYKEMGATFQEAYDLSLKDNGPCPHWEAVGVVHADEHFSGNLYRNNQKVEGEYKPEMWDRNERAKKRAAKGCYRKGFPKLNIPDAEEGQYIQDDNPEFKIKVIDAIKSDVLAEGNKPMRTEAQLLSDLGFDHGEPKKPEPAPEPTNLEQAEKIEPSAPVSDAVEKLAAGIREAMELYAKRPSLTETQENMIAPYIEGIFETGDQVAKRHSILLHLTGKSSLKDILPDTKKRLYGWLRPYQGQDKIWHVNEQATRQLMALMTAIDSANQPALI